MYATNKANHGNSDSNRSKGYDACGDDSLEIGCVNDIETSNANGEDGVKQNENGERKRKRKKVRRLELEEVENFNVKLAKRGVLYIARIPPAMGPARIKCLLSDFGEVTRIYLVEEDAAKRKRRRKAGGHGAKRYVEGWAEFADKAIAKRVGQCVNNTPMTNHKRSRHYGDLWSVKYLKKFTWNHLTEKVAYERRMREQKLMVEMMHARRENAAYASLVEQGRKIDKIEERRRKKALKLNEEIPTTADERKARFKQKAPVDEKKLSASKPVLQSLV